MKQEQSEYQNNVKITNCIFWISGLICIIWLIEILNLFLGHQLCNFGIFPRSINGLIGIPLSPFLHSSIRHTLSNTMPLIVLSGLIMLQGKRNFFMLSMFIIFIGGAGVWLFGRPYYHVGASGLIFGYFGFLIANGWYNRSLFSIIAALVTLFFYGGILWGVLPLSFKISWEGHLFGLLAGILWAYLKKKK